MKNDCSIQEREIDVLVGASGLPSMSCPNP